MRSGKRVFVIVGVMFILLAKGINIYAGSISVLNIPKSGPFTKDDTFIVNVDVIGTESLLELVGSLHFTKDKIQVISVEWNNAVIKAGFSPVTVSTIEMANKEGIFSFEGISIPILNPMPQAFGNTVLTVTFRCIDSGIGIIGDTSKAWILNSGYGSYGSYPPQTFIIATTPSISAKAIIVAGGGDYEENTLWKATKRCAMLARDALIFRGYFPENIYYLSAGEIVESSTDKIATKENFQNAVLKWATDTPELLIYMVDHGGDGIFRMNRTEDIDAATVSIWLDELQKIIPGNVVVIYDACQSGSFIEKLKGQKRIILTSASEDEPAMFESDGTLSFSWFFWSQFRSGSEFYTAFVNTEKSISRIRPQTPLLEADGNGIPNEKADRVKAEENKIGNESKIEGKDIPTVGKVSHQKLTDKNTSARIYADNVIAMGGIEKVFAVIFSPNSIGYPQNPLVYAKTMELNPVGEDRYEAEYGNFMNKGIYKIVVFAQDKNGLTSIPQLNNITHVVQVQENLYIDFCAEFQGVQYECKLKLYNEPEFIWELEKHSPLQYDPGNCIIVNDNLDDNDYTIKIRGEYWKSEDELALYEITIKPYPNPKESNGLYWKAVLSEKSVSQ